ncbi:MAG: hypothetical protein QXO22_01695 [Thermosphaera sp.]
MKTVYDRELLFRILGYKKIIDLKEEGMKTSYQLEITLHTP